MEAEHVARQAQFVSSSGRRYEEAQASTPHIPQGAQLVLNATVPNPALTYNKEVPF